MGVAGNHDSSVSRVQMHFGYAEGYQSAPCAALGEFVSRYTILSIDGGGVNVLMSLLMLRRIEQARPGFLAGTQLLAGTSAGGISALIVVAEADPVAGLDRAIEFWEGFPSVLRHSRQFLAGLAGAAPLYSHHRLRLALFQVLGSRTLRELQHKVLVASMQLDNGEIDPERRSWAPRSLTNLDGENDSYLDDLLIDIAMRSSAAPVVWPVHQGFVDGGLFANDPSMLALTSVLREQRDPDKSTEHGRDALPDILLLSIGEGNVPHHLAVQTGSWGYREWLMRREAPLALIELALNSTGEAISEQCRTLLGDAQYFRLNPDIKFPGGRGAPDLHPRSSVRRTLNWVAGATEDSLDPIHAQLARAREIGTSYDLGPVLSWIDAARWPRNDSRIDHNTSP